MNLFLKYNLRSINYEINWLKTPPDENLAPNSLYRDYTNDDSDDESMVTESNEEDSEIEFTDELEEEDI